MAIRLRRRKEAIQMAADRPKVPYWTCRTPEAKRIWCINEARRRNELACSNSRSNSRRSKR